MFRSRTTSGAPPGSQRRFSLLRLLLAVVVSGAMFAALRPFGGEAILPALLLTLAFGGLALVATRRNLRVVLFLFILLAIVLVAIQK